MMSQLVAVFLLILGLVAVAYLTVPSKSGRCCNDPSHQAPASICEMMYCAKRGS
jgi:hypothetical protein